MWVLRVVHTPTASARTFVAIAWAPSAPVAAATHCAPQTRTATLARLWVARDAVGALRKTSACLVVLLNPRPALHPVATGTTVQVVG